MLQALNTGHDGSLSTVHANSPADALARLETLVLLAGVALPLAAVRAQLASAIDAIVQVARGDARLARDRRGRRGRSPRAVVARSGVRTLLARRGGALAAVDAPTRAARRAGFDLEGGVVALHAVVVAADRCRGRGVARCASRAAGSRSPIGSDPISRRAGAGSRGSCARRSCRALDDAAVERAARAGGRDVAPRSGDRGGRRLRARAGDRSCSPASRCSPAVRSRSSPRGHRRARLVAAAVPDTLEQVGAELRAGGTVATALAAIAGGDGPLAPDLARVEARVRLGRLAARRAPRVGTRAAGGRRRRDGRRARAERDGGRPRRRRARRARVVAARPSRGRGRGACALGAGPVLGLGDRRRARRLHRQLGRGRPALGARACRHRRRAGVRVLPASGSSSSARCGCARSCGRETRHDARSSGSRAARSPRCRSRALARRERVAVAACVRSRRAGARSPARCSRRRRRPAAPRTRARRRSCGSLAVPRRAAGAGARDDAIVGRELPVVVDLVGVAVVGRAARRTSRSSTPRATDRRAPPRRFAA